VHGGVLFGGTVTSQRIHETAYSGELVPRKQFVGGPDERLSLTHAIKGSYSYGTTRKGSERELSPSYG
jgi:hypothetical protein